VWGRPTASSKAKACPRGAGDGEDFEDGTVVVGEAGEEEDFRSIIYSRAILTLGSSEAVLFKLYSDLTSADLRTIGDLCSRPHPESVRLHAMARVSFKIFPCTVGQILYSRRCAKEFFFFLTVKSKFTWL